MFISEDQWQQLGRDSFDGRVMALLRRADPARTASIDAAALRSQIQRQALRAQGYGLADERSAALYVCTAWLLGLEFDERIPAMAQVLREPALPGPVKAQALADFSKTVFGHLRAEAAS